MKKELFSISKIGVLIGSFLITNLSFSQSSEVWSDVQERSIKSNKSIRYIHPVKYRLLTLDIEALKKNLSSTQLQSNNSKNDGITMSMPNPDGGFSNYRVFNNATMHPDLAAKFPEIKSYNAVNIEDPSEVVKIDITPQGFHAMILSAKRGTIFIDPYAKGDINNYQVYLKKDYSSNDSRHCELSENKQILDSKLNEPSNKVFGSCELRTYRLALAATGEYTAAVGGGTVAGALAAQVTTMNRVNGIYERDLAITMTIIPNNNLLIYTNGSTDPYSNNSSGALLGENQSNVSSLIGNSNYDIGHVFSTGGGGIASLGSVCSFSNKARGVTGLPNPQGDAFDIDFVAHEIGHQFSGQHSYNGTDGNCGGQRSNSTSYEVGSGTTIMGYAGICGSDNVQNNSDALFHGISLQEIGNFITSSNHTCPVKTPLNNTAPVMVSTNAGVTIPSGTPFALTASATDADGDALTYTWEQFDRQISTQPPVSTFPVGPNFRAFDVTPNPTRYFPNLVSLRSNGPFTWEVLPTVSRTLNFRATVRDNAAGGGCTDHLDVSLTVDGNTGPFLVTSPNTTGINWPVGSWQEITWDVAGTDGGAVDCDFVDVFLSVDAGETYPILLAANTENDGSVVITTPNNVTPVARVMVMCSNGTFFDISNFFHSIDNSVGIDDGLRPDQSIKSFYNNNNINLSLTNLDKGEYNLVVVNALGQQLMSQPLTISNDIEKQRISFSGKAEGIYYISVYNDNIRYNTKFFKQ